MSVQKTLLIHSRAPWFLFSNCLHQKQKPKITAEKTFRCAMSAEAKTIKCMSHSRQRERCRILQNKSIYKIHAASHWTGTRIKTGRLQHHKENSVNSARSNGRAFAESTNSTCAVWLSSYPLLCKWIKAPSWNNWRSQENAFKREVQDWMEMCPIVKLNFTSLPFCSEWNCKVLSWMFCFVLLFHFGVSRCAFQSEKRLLRKCSPLKKTLMTGGEKG